MSYYMGDYYRGDPGIGSFFSKALGFVGKLGIPGVSTAASAGSAILSKVAGGGVTAAAGAASKAVSTAIIKHPVLSAAGAAGALGTMAGAGAIAERMVGGGGRRAGKPTLKKCGMPLKHGGVGKCHRSMNVCNPRALRRAIRRTRGFAKLAMRTIHIVHPKKKGRFGGFKTRRRK